MKTLKGFLGPHWAVSLVLTIILINFFQALLLRQINDSTTTLRKNLDMWLVLTANGTL